MARNWSAFGLIFMQSLSLVRIGAFVLAVLLGGYAAWMLTLEMMRPSPPSFPFADIASTSSDRDRAAAAAQIGVIRGDLWADEAILLASGLLDEAAAGTARPAPESLGAARDAAERAVSLAPHDSRIWLLIAAIDAKLERRTEALLKMSYYTAPNDVALMTLCDCGLQRDRRPFRIRTCRSWYPERCAPS